MLFYGGGTPNIVGALSGRCSSKINRKEAAGFAPVAQVWIAFFECHAKAASGLRNHLMMQTQFAMWHFLVFKKCVYYRTQGQSQRPENTNLKLCKMSKTKKMRL